MTKKKSPPKKPLQDKTKLNAVVETSVYEQHCHHVLRVVANYFGHKMLDMLASTRKEKSIALARQIAMYLSHTHYGVPMTQVGHSYGRDRTTVGFACRKIEDRRDEAKLDTIISCLEMLLMNTDAPHVSLLASASSLKGMPNHV